MRGLDDGTAIVTGGSSGIGRATAKRLADEGVNVVIADVDEEQGPTSPGRCYRSTGDRRRTMWAFPSCNQISGTLRTDITRFVVGETVRLCVDDGRRWALDACGCCAMFAHPQFISDSLARPWV